MSLCRYAGAQVSICEAVRSFPNPPTGDGADVSSWNGANGSTNDFELTSMAGADVELAAGAMLVAEEVFDTFPEESDDVTLTNGTEIVNLAAHGFYTGDGPIRLSGTLPAQLADDVEYYVIRASADTFKLADTREHALAGTAVAFGSDGSGVKVHWVTGIKSSAILATDVDEDEDTYVKADHGLSQGQRVQVITETTLPDGLTANTDYYVILVDEDTVKLASTPELAEAGTPVDLIDDGTGTQSIVANFYAATEATIFTMFSLLNGGDAIDLTADIGYRERLEHRPSVVAYHLVATLDVFAPLTAYVRPIEVPL